MLQGDFFGFALADGILGRHAGLPGLDEPGDRGSPGPVGEYGEALCIGNSGEAACG